MKTILKFVYGFFVIVVAVIVYLGMDQSFSSKNYIDLLNNASTKAINEKDYDDLARCFSIFSTPIEKEKVALKGVSETESVTAIYSSVSQFSATYFEDGNSKDSQRIEYAYLVIISNPKFQFESSSDGTNKTSFRFYGLNKDNEEVTYDYNFKLSEDTNASNFIGKPQNEKEAVLHGKRDLITDYRPYNLLFFPIFQTTIKYIMEEGNMVSVNGFNVVENTGKAIYDTKVECKLDFSQKITSDLATWLEYVNKYNELDEEELTSIVNYLNEFTADPNTYVSNFDNNYLLGYAKEDIYTSNIVGQSIGIVVLFLVVAVLIYFVLFHLNKIKEFVARFSKKTPERNVPNKEIRTQTVISKSGVKKEDVVDAKIEEVNTSDNSQE